MKLRSAKRYFGGTLGGALVVAILALPLILIACGGEEVVEEVAETVEWGYSGAGAPGELGIDIGGECELR